MNLFILKATFDIIRFGTSPYNIIGIFDSIEKAEIESKNYKEKIENDYNEIKEELILLEERIKDEEEFDDEFWKHFYNLENIKNDYFFFRKCEILPFELNEVKT